MRSCGMRANETIVEFKLGGLKKAHGDFNNERNPYQILRYYENCSCEEKNYTDRINALLK